MNNGVFDAIKLGTFHQSAREIPKGRRHQRQPSSQASEKPAITCCKSDQLSGVERRGVLPKTQRVAATRGQYVTYGPEKSLLTNPC